MGRFHGHHVAYDSRAPQARHGSPGKKLVNFKCFLSQGTEKAFDLKESGSFTDTRRNPHPALASGLFSAGSVTGLGGGRSAELAAHLAQTNVAHAAGISRCASKERRKGQRERAKRGPSGLSALKSQGLWGLSCLLKVIPHVLCRFDLILTCLVPKLSPRTGTPKRVPFHIPSLNAAPERSRRRHIFPVPLGEAPPAPPAPVTHLSSPCSAC